MPQDNTLAKARKIGALNGLQTFRDSVGQRDKNDFYTFTLNQRSSLNLSLSKLKNNVDVTLMQNGQTLLKSARPKNKPEAIGTLLEPGTYHIRVSAKRGDSKYQLKLGASPLLPTVDAPDVPPPSPTEPSAPNPSPPLFPISASRFLSTSASEIGTIDPTTGVFSPLSSASAAYNDLASAPSGELFGASASSLYRIDRTTGTSAQIGNFGTSVNMDSLTFAVDSLYAAGSSGFYRINSATGSASLIANIPGFDSSGDLIYDGASGRFLATSKNSAAKDSLYSIALDGSATLVGDVGFSNVWGLALENDVLYGYTSNRLQVIIDRTTGKGTFDRSITGTTAQIYGAT
jgi:Bacterial pre-peptidase C-terminal domain